MKSTRCPPDSLSYVRSKIYNHSLSPKEIDAIIQDISHERYTDTQVAAFLTACATGQLNVDEITALTESMVKVGAQLKWDKEIIVDKHCVGGLPGNRTTPIVVAIVAAFGLTIPKTSSRAITSCSGTADTMEVFTNVELSLADMRKVVEQENGCMVWGGSMSLSPADDILIRVEHDLDIDSEAQLVASVLSKKIAAGSSHILIDIPIGITAKVRTITMADLLKTAFEQVSQRLGIDTKCIYTDGSQPIGQGIGPALEAKDILKVLQNAPDAPEDLLKKSLMLAGEVLEFSDNVPENTGYQVAEEILLSGQAWEKFVAICEAQGGFKEPETAKHQQVVSAPLSGRIIGINNRSMARIAKCAGAPNTKTAGVELHVHIDDVVQAGDPLFSIHSESKSLLEDSRCLLQHEGEIVTIEHGS